MRKTLRLVALAAVPVLVAVALALRPQVSERILSALTHARHLPPSPALPGQVVYALGGTPESLQAKFIVAARLIREGRATRVLVLSQQGPMEFSPVLGRNLTANEWALARLGALGVAAGAVDLVEVEQGFFGTWSEAKTLIPYARQRGYARLILVTSAYHSRRTWESFSVASGDAAADLYLYLSDEPSYLRHTLPELIKLHLYRILLF